MRTGVAKAGHGPVRGDHLLEVVEVDIEAAVVEQLLAIAFQRQSQPRLHRVFASRGGDVGEALVTLLRVAGPFRPAHRVNASGGFEHLLVQVFVFPHLGHQLGAEVGVANSL